MQPRLASKSKSSYHCLSDAKYIFLRKQETYYKIHRFIENSESQRLLVEPLPGVHKTSNSAPGPTLTWHGVHTCNPRTWEVGAGGSRVQGYLPLPRVQSQPGIKDQVWRVTSVIPILWRPRQEDFWEFQVILCYITSRFLRKTTTRRTTISAKEHEKKGDIQQPQPCPECSAVGFSHTQGNEALLWPGLPGKQLLRQTSQTSFSKEGSIGQKGGLTEGALPELPSLKVGTGQTFPVSTTGGKQGTWQALAQGRAEWQNYLEAGVSV